MNDRSSSWECPSNVFQLPMPPLIQSSHFLSKNLTRVLLSLMSLESPSGLLNSFDCMLYWLLLCSPLVIPPSFIPEPSCQEEKGNRRRGERITSRVDKNAMMTNEESNETSLSLSLDSDPIAIHSFHFASFSRRYCLLCLHQWWVALKTGTVCVMSSRDSDELIFNKIEAGNPGQSDSHLLSLCLHFFI